MRSAYGWLEIVTLALQPFVAVSSAITLRNVQQDQFFYNNLVKYIMLLVKAVERCILEALSDQFSIVSDVCMVGSTYYDAVFATFTFYNAAGWKQALKGFSQLENEKMQDATQHFSYVSYAFEFRGKTFNSVATIIGDNTNVNKAFSKRATEPFAGYVIHLFNLSFKDFQEPYQTFTDNLQRLLKNLSTAPLIAKLYIHTSLTPQLSSATR